MIFLYQRMLVHYRIPVYQHLNEALDGQLILVYGQQPNKAEHLTQDKQRYTFRSLKLRNRWFGGERAVWQPFLKPFQVFGKPDVVIIEHNPRILSSYPLRAYCLARGIPFLLWGHGSSRKRDVASENSAKDAIHRWFIRHCDAYICYTDAIKKKLSNITEPEKLFVANNTLDTDILFGLRKKLEAEGRNTVKERLGLHKAYYLCFIGRLVQEKQPDMLLDALQILQRIRDDIGTVIIGGGPEMETLKRRTYELNLEDVHFTGAIAEWERSAPYLFACDVLVNLGCVGLSVNHAFSFGLPVITQQSSPKGPFHGPEVTFIKEGYTGYFTPIGNVEAMANRIAEILVERERWYRNIIIYAEKELTIDKMINGMVSAINYTLKY